MSKKAPDMDWKQDPLENTPPVRGSGNFLKDRGYSDPTECRIRFDLVSIIRSVVEAKSPRQIDVVALVGPQPSCSGALVSAVGTFGNGPLRVASAGSTAKVSTKVDNKKCKA